ncbi:ATP-binding cassette domain-containing protein [Glutamicibacter sp.]|uniref:ATP-binding cassette domain-containing protein n=1 Tax=Glutamicibacter sp. TaxID=1931995 RepID=UPI002FE0CE33
MSLKLESVTLNLAGRQVLPPTTLNVPAGRLLGLTAPSGAGKTSLISLAALLQRPTSGRIILDGVPVPSELPTARIPVALRQQIGVLPQNPRSFADPRLTLAETITAPLAFRDHRTRPAPQRYQEQLLDLARQMRLPESLLSRLPSQVSDGQLQRALMARALSLSPRILLCDEPTSALDPTTTAAIFQVLRAAADNGVSVLVASHDRSSLVQYCDKVVALSELQLKN